MEIVVDLILYASGCHYDLLVLKNREKFSQNTKLLIGKPFFKMDPNRKIIAIDSNNPPTWMIEEELIRELEQKRKEGKHLNFLQVVSNFCNKHCNHLLVGKQSTGKEEFVEKSPTELPELEDCR
jgi:hypothetical protein